MFVRIDPDSKIPIYLQIYESIVSAIAKKEVQDGTILPSARKLAKDLGINYHTANKAYNLLEIEGFARISGRKTIIVTEIDTSRKNEFIDKWNMVQVELIKEAIAKGFDREQVEALLSKLLNALFNGENGV